MPTQTPCNVGENGHAILQLHGKRRAWKNLLHHSIDFYRRLFRGQRWSLDAGLLSELAPRRSRASYDVLVSRMFITQLLSITSERIRPARFFSILRLCSDANEDTILGQQLLHGRRIAGLCRYQRYALRSLSELARIYRSQLRLAAAVLTLRKAISAVDRLVSSRLKRHLRIFAAAAARCWEHFALWATAPGVSATAASAALCLACRTAIGAAAGLVREALRSEKFLLAGGKGERRAAINAGQGLVGVRRFLRASFSVTDGGRTSAAAPHVTHFCRAGHLRV